MRWRLVLPVLGLILFAGVTNNSLRTNREIQRSPNRYFWWSSMRLDSDPLNRRPLAAEPCNDSAEKCAGWTTEFIWVDPGWIAKSLLLSAFPAFMFGSIIIRGLGRLGISEVTSFMVLMPLLIFVWYYFVGWLVECWRYKRPGNARMISKSVDVEQSSSHQ
jgi:hypothetical protein